MTQRYHRLYSLPQNLYTDGAPLLISAGALLWDTQMNRILVQLKLTCISRKGLRGVHVEIQPQDLAERPLGAPVRYDYMDLSVGYGMSFGTKNPILLTDPLTRSFSVTVKEAVFGDRSVWQGEEVWKPLKQPETLEQGLGEDLAREYRLLYGWDCQNMPMHCRGLWQCSCGTLYSDDQESCPVCGRESREPDRAALEQARQTRLETVRKTVQEEEKRAAEAAEAARLAAEEQARREEEARQAAEERAIQEALEEEERLKIVARWHAQQEAEAMRKEERLKIGAHRHARQDEQGNDLQPEPPETEAAERPAEPEEAAVQKKKKKRWVLPVLLLILAGLAAGVWFIGIPQYRYMNAEKLEAEGKLEEAAQAFAELGAFRDSEQRAAENREAAEQEKKEAEEAAAAAAAAEARAKWEAEMEALGIVSLSQCKAGDYVQFGAYEQDGNEEDGAEPITWIVLRRKGNQVLLVSKDCLAIMPFHSGEGEVSWELSSLRAWLNEDFYDAAFSGDTDLRPAIATTVVTSPLGGSARTTHDKVFLLSNDNVKLYLDGKLDAALLVPNVTPACGKVQPTGWWLCAPLERVEGGILAAIVPVTGDGYENVEADSAYGVRPAIWVDLGKLD